MKVQPDPDNPFSTELGAVATAQLGAVDEAAPASDTASSGANGRLQRIAQRLTSMIAFFIAGGVTADSVGLPVMGRYRSTKPTLVDGEYRSLGFDTRNNLCVAVFGQDNSVAAGVQPGADGSNNGTVGLSVIARGAVYNGSSWDRVRGDLNGQVIQADALASARWAYAPPSGGIVNTTTAVTFIAAAGAGVRNYCRSAEITAEALGSATEIAIRDGAGGTVLWRSKIGTAGWPNGRTIRFDPPLRGSANTLMEIVTLTASVTGAVHANLQGYQGT